MDAFNFITVRLGKDSINDINLICSSEVGIVSQSFNITVKCTQIPDNYAPNDYAFIWLGSDNNKGAPTKWKQGFKAVGKVTDIRRGANYNDTSETTLEILYIFRESINRIDILRFAPNEYYWCSSFPLIGIDDHANQTIRLMSGAELSDIKAFFRALDKASDHFKKEIIKVQPGFEPYFDVYIPSPKDFPNTNNLSEIERRKESNNNKGCLQQIFYGAPGTGKSHKIKDDENVKEADKKNLVFRTTFHPDSDYSTFVGAYKPTMKESFITKDGVTTKEEKIIYTFCPQAFTNAYVETWNTEEEVYLVIEEINRGNCAQIFGDLFQLLDRKNGVSEYPVEADADLQSYLNKALAKTARTDIPDDVKSGKKLMLPSNLYIWATMNTSDQSLFPIDSAFKRRWEWKYIKIKEGRDENGNKLDWKVDVKMDETGNVLSWWAFIQKINEIIASMTSSADKQLGYFFCCAKNGVIDEETFVSKVIFYLWNDVFKDYGFEDSSLFRYTDNDGKEKDLTFPDFYDEDGEKVSTERLTDFVKKVMDWKKTSEENS